MKAIQYLMDAITAGLIGSVLFVLVEVLVGR
jgi:hypothetical protein